ncbi:conserved hypothetical protein [Xanthomonas oryzae pv. oryzae MAFF 311018]|nr:conserved hypothetical protein [Xanthomonas oryzae pv. oryzae MAFF 311018]
MTAACQCNALTARDAKGRRRIVMFRQHRRKTTVARLPPSVDPSPAPLILKIHHFSAAVLAALVLAPAAYAADLDVSADTGTSVQQLDTVSAIGKGETRQVQRITQQDVPVLPPGTSIQKLLNRMPGVNVQSNDAFGANEESQTISLRGFNGTRLGYTLDGLPLGDNAYGNYNGLNISRALIAENFGGV